MCTIHMRVHCSEKFSEVLVGEVEQTELAIESLVGTALLEFFGDVHVENVTVVPTQNESVVMESDDSAGCENAWT